MSEHKIHARSETIEEIAETLAVKWDIPVKGGAVIANPIPEEDAMDEAYITKMIEAAVKEAEEKSILGKDVTPFLLEKVTEETEGKSLEANIRLEEHTYELQ